MKKQRSNNKFLKIAAVSLALLALPPLAVYGQTVRCRAAQPRPALPGVMSDEIRLDPVAGALYRYGVQGGINRADSYWSDNVFTVLRGKLKQAAARAFSAGSSLTTCWTAWPRARPTPGRCSRKTAACRSSATGAATRAISRL